MRGTNRTILLFFSHVPTTPRYDYILKWNAKRNTHNPFWCYLTKYTFNRFEFHDFFFKYFPGTNTSKNRCLHLTSFTAAFLLFFSRFTPRPVSVTNNMKMAEKEKDVNGWPSWCFHSLYSLPLRNLVFIYAKWPSVCHSTGKEANNFVQRFN